MSLFGRSRNMGGLFRPKSVRTFFTKTVPKVQKFAGRVGDIAGKAKNVVKTLEKVVPESAAVLGPVEAGLSLTERGANTISRL